MTRARTLITRAIRRPITRTSSITLTTMTILTIIITIMAIALKVIIVIL